MKCDVKIDGFIFSVVSVSVTLTSCINYIEGKLITMWCPTYWKRVAEQKKRTKKQQQQQNCTQKQIVYTESKEFRSIYDEMQCEDSKLSHHISQALPFVFAIFARLSLSFSRQHLSLSLVVRIKPQRIGYVRIGFYQYFFGVFFLYFFSLDSMSNRGADMRHLANCEPICYGSIEMRWMRVCVHCGTIGNAINRFM